MEVLLVALGVIVALLLPALGVALPILAWVRANEAKRRVEEIALGMHEENARMQRELLEARRAFDSLALEVQRLRALPVAPAPTPAPRSSEAATVAETSVPAIAAPQPALPEAWPVPTPAEAVAHEPAVVVERAPVPLAEPSADLSIEAAPTTSEPAPQTVPAPDPSPTVIAAPAIAARETAEAIANEPIAPAAPAAPETLEEKIGLVWFTRIGAAALLLGVAYFFKYAVDNAWIGPVGRLIAGAVLGAGLLGFAERGREKTKPIFSNVIVGAGLSTLLFTAYASHAFYDVVPASLATLAIAAISIGGGFLAVRHRAEAILILSSVAALAAPVLLSTGTDQPLALFAYVSFVSVLAHFAAVRGSFALAPWISILGTVALFFGWYDRFFDVPYPAGIGAASSAHHYGSLAARAVPLGALAVFSAQWLALYAVVRVRDLQGFRPLGYVIAALAFASAGSACLLYDEPATLLGVLVALATVTAFVVEREGTAQKPAAWLFLISELAAALTFAVVAGRASSSVVPVMIALGARALVVGYGASRGFAREKAVSIVVTSLAGLIFVGSSAATLGPDHPHTFLVLLAAVSAAIVGTGYLARSTALPATALVASFPFLFVGAPRSTGLSMTSLAPAVDTIDGTFLGLVFAWAAVWIAGPLAGIVTKRDQPTATPVLTSGLASLAFVGLLLGYTPESASLLRALAFLGLAIVHFGVGTVVFRRGAPGLANVPFGLALALLATSVALVASGVSITLVWAALACLVAVLAFREKNDVWLGFSFVLFASTLVHLLVKDIDLPERARILYFSSEGALGQLTPPFLFHPRALSLLGTATALFVTAFAGRASKQGSGRTLAALASLAGHGLALGLVVSEARGLAFSPPNLASLGSRAREQAWFEAVVQQADGVGVVTTLAIGLYAIAVLVIGFRARSVLPRYLGLALFVLALGKLGLYDIWYLPRVYQIGALVGTGALLLSASFLYARFGKRLVTLLTTADAGAAAAAATSEAEGGGAPKG